MLLFILAITFSYTPQAQNSVYEFSVDLIDGTSINLSDFKGKKLLLVNTASKCGFTPQYEELQKLHVKYGENLIIIGFPANNFGAQEPGSNEDIEEFCQKNYGVEFLMAAKISVKGDDIHPLFKFLIEQDNPDFKGDIKWNFEKFLINEQGFLINRFRSTTSPLSNKIISAL